MIVIVGAGPIGCYLGEELAKAGKEVSIYEEHPSIGKPVQCTGIITREIEKLMRLPDNVVVNEINRVRVYSKNRKVELPIDDIVIDRAKFDRYLAKKAKEYGASIYLNQKFIGIRGKNAVFADRRNKIKKVEAEAIIGADGPLSEVAKANDMFENRGFYFGMQVRVRGRWDKEVYETWMGSIAPGFFAWLLPESDKTARVGIAAKTGTKELFRRFFDIMGLKDKDVIEFQAGLIPIFDKKQAVKKKRVYLVGDAAGHVKASTGGGLVPGMKAARKLAKVLIKGGDYEKELAGLKKELEMHLRLRKGLDRFSNKDYDRLIGLVGSRKIKKIIRKHNRDEAKKLVFKAVMAKPSVLRFTTKFIN